MFLAKQRKNTNNFTSEYNDDTGVETGAVTPSALEDRIEIVDEVKDVITVNANNTRAIDERTFVEHINNGKSKRRSLRLAAERTMRPMVPSKETKKQQPPFQNQVLRLKESESVSKKRKSSSIMELQPTESEMKSRHFHNPEMKIQLPTNKKRKLNCSHNNNQDDADDDVAKIQKDDSSSSKWTCGVCPLTFLSKKSLHNHWREHVKNRFFCSVNCGQFFEALEECEAHEHGQHRISIIKCNVCNHKFVTYEALGHHKFLMHRQLERFNCSLCREWFISSSELMQHWLTTATNCGQLIAIILGDKSFIMPLKLRCKFDDFKNQLNHGVESMNTASSSSLFASSKSLAGVTQARCDEKENDACEENNENLEQFNAVHEISTQNRKKNQRWVLKNCFKKKLKNSEKIETTKISDLFQYEQKTDNKTVKEEKEEDKGNKENNDEKQKEYQLADLNSNPIKTEMDMYTSGTTMICVKVEPIENDTDDNVNNNYNDDNTAVLIDNHANYDQDADEKTTMIQFKEEPRDGDTTADAIKTFKIKQEPVDDINDDFIWKDMNMETNKLEIKTECEYDENMMSKLEANIDDEDNNDNDCNYNQVTSPKLISINPLPATAAATKAKVAITPNFSLQTIPKLLHILPSSASSTSSSLSNAKEEKVLLSPIKLQNGAHILKLPSNIKFFRLPTPTKTTTQMSIIGETLSNKMNPVLSLKPLTTAKSTPSTTTTTNAIKHLEFPTIEARLLLNNPKFVLKKVQIPIASHSKIPPKTTAIPTITTTTTTKINNTPTTVKITPTMNITPSSMKISPTTIPFSPTNKSLMITTGETSPITFKTCKTENINNDDDDISNTTANVDDNFKNDDAFDNKKPNNKSKCSRSRSRKGVTEANRYVCKQVLDDIEKLPEKRIVIENILKQIKETSTASAKTVGTLTKMMSNHNEKLLDIMADDDDDNHKIKSKTKSNAARSSSSSSPIPTAALQIVKTEIIDEDDNDDDDDIGESISDSISDATTTTSTPCAANDIVITGDGVNDFVKVCNVSAADKIAPSSFYFSVLEKCNILKIGEMRKQYPQYMFAWICTHCSCKYELKTTFCAHLTKEHGILERDYGEFVFEVRPFRYAASRNAIDNDDDEVKNAIELVKKPTKQRNPSKKRPKDAFECYKCGRICSSRAMLNDHIRANCSREPQYPCKQCAKKFFSASTLACHVTIHTGVLPHKCSYCDKRFRTRGQVTVHHRTHTGEKPFICQVCSQGFTHRETLISHLSRHIGMKRYRCYACDKQFSCISGLRMHRDVRPDTCGKVKLNSRAVGPRVRVIKGQVVFEAQPEINPYLRTEDPMEILAEIQNQQKQKQKQQ